MTTNAKPCPSSAREITLPDQAELVALVLVAAERLVGPSPAVALPLSMWALALPSCAAPPPPESHLPLAAII